MDSLAFPAGASPFAAQSSGVRQRQVQTLSEGCFSSRERPQAQISRLHVSCNRSITEATFHPDVLLEALVPVELWSKSENN